MFIHFHRKPRDQWTNVMLNKESVKENPQNASTLDLKVEAKLAKCGGALEDVHK